MGPRTYAVQDDQLGVTLFKSPPARIHILARDFQQNLHHTGSVIAFSSGIQGGVLRLGINLDLSDRIACPPRKEIKLHPQELVTRAQDITTILTATLPNLHFQAYTLQQSTEAPSLYLFAFLSQDILIGGYRVEARLPEEVFAQRVVSIAQFFNKIEGGEEVKFFPPEVQTDYENHRNTGDLLHRVA